MREARGRPAVEARGAASVYGLHAVRIMLERHPERVSAIRLSERREDPMIRRIEELARAAGVPVQRVDAQVLRQKLGEAAHQGVLAEISALAPWSEDQLLSALQSARQPLLLALDGVQDPHNLGACLRVADAMGAHAVIAPKDRAAGLGAVAIKASSGAADSVPYIPVTNLARSLRELKERGILIVGTDQDGALAVSEADFSGAAALVLGAEGEGMRRLTREHCDVLVRIPMFGQVESLNVSVSAGVCLYEARRQRSLLER